jgi:hypothetical protein
MQMAKAEGYSLLSSGQNLPKLCFIFQDVRLCDNAATLVITTVCYRMVV